MSIPQLHQLARQIKALRRIREQMKCIHNKQPFHLSAAAAPWGVALTNRNFLESSNQAQENAAKQTRKRSKKAQCLPVAKPASKRAK